MYPGYRSVLLWGATSPPDTHEAIQKSLYGVSFVYRVQSHFNWFLQPVTGNSFPVSGAQLKLFFFSFPISLSATVLVLSVTCGPSLKRPYQLGSTLVRVETVASWKITFGRRSLSRSRESIFTWRLQEAASRSPSLEETLITQEEPPGSSGSTSSRMKTGSKI